MGVNIAHYIYGVFSPKLMDVTTQSNTRTAMLHIHSFWNRNLARCRHCKEQLRVLAICFCSICTLDQNDSTTRVSTKARLQT